MTELLIIKDPHFAFGFRNNIRKDYEGDIRAKLDYISNYCIQNDISKIVFTGDVFDAQYDKKWSFKQYLKNKEILQEYFITHGIELYSIAGNHDFFNGHETLGGTILGEMVDQGIIHYLTAQPLETDDLIIYGLNYSRDLSRITEKLMTINEHMHKKPVFIVLHQNITIDKTPFTDYTYDFLIKAFSNITGYILGHYHVAEVPEGVFYVKDQTGRKHVFISPWNLTRVVRDYYVKMDQFEVSAIHMRVTSHNSAKFGFEFINVPIPYKNFSEAFIPEMIYLTHASKQEQFQFFESVNIDEVKQGLSDDELLLELGEKNSFSKEVIKKAIEYLGTQ